MKKNIVLTFIVVALLAATAFLASCSKSDSAAAANAPSAATVTVRAETLSPARIIDAIQVAGTIKAYEDVMIAPEEGGVVREWKVEKGQYVRKGALIVTLRDEVIKASYDAAKAQYEMAALNLDKQEKVFEQQGISELQYKNLQFSRDAAKANADLMKARWERTQIVSPINGILEDHAADEGEFAPPAVPIARVVNADRVKIQAEVPERFAGMVSLGTKAEVTFDAFPDDTLRGTVSFVGTTVSSANRSLLVEIVLNNPSRRLKPEMIAKVNLVRAVKAAAVVVSENIIQLVDRDRRIVYVVEGGKAVERRVKLGARQGMMVEIVEGLRAGERVVVAGFQKLTTGTPVAVVN